MKNVCLTKQVITTLLFTIGFCFYQTSLYSNTKSAAEDSALVRQYIDSGTEFLSSNSGKAILLFDTAATLSKNMDWHNRTAASFIYQAFAYRTIQKKVEMLAACDSAYYYYEQEDNLLGKIDALYNKGSFLVEFEEFDKGAGVLEIAIELSLLTDDFKRQTKAYTNAGLARQYLGHYKLAFQHHLTAAKLREQHYLPQIENSYLNIGLALFDQGDFSESITYSKKAYDIGVKNDDLFIIRLSAKNIGSAFSKIQSYDSSLFYYEKSLLLSKELHDTLGYANTLLSYGQLYLKQKDFDKSRLYLDSARLLGIPFENQRFSSTLYLAYSDLFLALFENDRNCLDSSLYYSQLSLEAGKKTQTLPKIISAKENLIVVHEYMGNLNTALQLSKELQTLKDSIQRIEKTKTIIEARELYKAEKRELEINLLQQKNLNKEQDLEKVKRQKENQSYMLVTGGFVLLFSILGLLFLFRLYKLKNKAFRELEERNAIIKKQDEEKELLLKEIHHRVKNNLQIIHSLLDIQRSKYPDLNNQKVVQESQNRIKAMALIHEKLYENNDLSKVSFENYAKELSEQLQKSFKDSSTVKIHVHSIDQTFDIDTIVPIGLILSELITNSFKYAFVEHNGRIDITLSKVSEGKLALIVADSGKEFDFLGALSKPKSIGLKLIQRLSKQIKGELSYSYDQGSVFTIVFSK
jgi:two-component sensor histidine kinase